MGMTDRPMILCGPIVRRATTAGVSVFVVTREACEITLSVGDTAERARGTRRTARIGQGLHVAVITARPDALGPGLAWGGDYGYGLHLKGDGFAGGLDDAGILVTRAPQRYTAIQRLLLDAEDRPRVVLPPEDPKDLALLTGSCRKPHGVGPDGLATADVLLRRGRADGKPHHQLLLTGDQIYADDVHPDLLLGASVVGDALVGPGERARLEASQPSLGDLKNAKARGAAVRTYGQLTTGAGGHLLTLGEFLGMYLLAWSNRVWPAELVKHLRGLGGTNRLWNFFQALSMAQRALANVPTYMIFDDHEITDDWALRARWNAQVLRTSLGRRVVRNGLVAYAVCQHWGNVPEDFEPGGPGAALLDLLADYTGAEPDDHPRIKAIERLVGLPMPGELDCAAWGDSLADAARAAGQPLPFRWGYQVDAPGCRVSFLDGRTRRQYPDGRLLTLMSEADIHAALPTAEDEPDLRLHVVVAPSPVIGVKVIELGQQVSDSFDWAASKDAEAWVISTTFDAMLDRLLDGPPTLVLSGDVHYGFATVADGRGRRAGKRVVNFTASALNNTGMEGWYSWIFKGEKLEHNEPGDGAIAVIPVAQRSLTLGEGADDTVTVALLDADGLPAAPDAFTFEHSATQTRSPLIWQTNLGEVRFTEERVYLTLHYADGADWRATTQSPRFPRAAD